MLTMVVAQYSTQQSDSLSNQIRDDQISRMLSQVGVLDGALHQMVVNGEDAAALYTNLSQLKPGDAGFETAPNNFKIYHPLGGGISYMSSSTTDATAAVATNFNINAASIITGVGATDAVTGDLVFTAKISSASYCQRINQTINGPAGVPPVMATATFDPLFNNPPTTTVTVSNANCASCVNMPRLCVSNGGATAWGFYASLFPG